VTELQFGTHHEELKLREIKMPHVLAIKSSLQHRPVFQGHLTVLRIKDQYGNPILLVGDGNHRLYAILLTRRWFRKNGHANVPMGKILIEEFADISIAEFRKICVERNRWHENASTFEDHEIMMVSLRTS